MARLMAWLSLCGVSLLVVVPTGAAVAKPILVFKNLRADVDVIPEARAGFAVKVTRGSATDADPVVAIQGDKASISGTVNTGVPGYRTSFNLDRGMNIASTKQLAHQPKARPASLVHIVVHAPLALSIKSNGLVFGHVGPSQSLKIEDNGGGDWVIDKVDQDVAVNAHGNADFHLGSATDASIDMLGTGNLAMGDVQSLFLSVYGSGDVSVGAVATRADVTIGGIGDFTARSISGTLLIEMEDAGHVRVEHGNLARLTVRTLDGLGSIDFGGTVQDADISIGTRTAVRLHRVTGTIKKSLRDDATLAIDSP